MCAGHTHLANGMMCLQRLRVRTSQARPTLHLHTGTLSLQPARVGMWTALLGVQHAGLAAPSVGPGAATAARHCGPAEEGGLGVAGTVVGPPRTLVLAPKVVQ